MHTHVITRKGTWQDECRKAAWKAPGIFARWAPAGCTACSPPTAACRKWIHAWPPTPWPLQPCSATASSATPWPISRRYSC